jgi:hypothetical protein
MPAALLLAAALAVQAPATVSLNIRVFDGSDEVTHDTRITLFRAGEHQSPVAEVRGSGPLITTVPAGIYDAQAIHEKDGRVVGLRWAERLVVMPYPDEQGQHLEIINLQSGFGALQVRGQSGETPDVAMFAAGDHQQEAAKPVSLAAGALFVVPAGRYDLRVRRDGATTWHPGIEVPVDRTRFWVAQ